MLKGLLKDIQNEARGSDQGDPQELSQKLSYCKTFLILHKK